MNCNSKNSLLPLTALMLLIVPSAVFLWRYAMRVMPESAAWVPGVVYAAASGAIIIYVGKSAKLMSSKWLMPAIGVAWCIIAAGFTALLPLDELKVDRWDMIQSFWDAVFAGNYPYASEGTFSHSNPGGMPMYFVFTLPFYVFNNYASIPLIGFILWAAYTRLTETREDMNIMLMLICTSFICFWEVICRSSVFYNAAIFFMWFFTLRNFKEKSTWGLIASGVIGGLVLSTRGTFGIPLIIFGIYSLRSGAGFRRVALWSVTVISTFALTFLPFILVWGMEAFNTINPFIIQTRIMLPIISYPIMALSVVPALMCKKFDHVIYSSGIYMALITLSALFICPFTLHMDVKSVALMHDFSYIALSYPCLFYIIQKWLTERK